MINSFWEPPFFDGVDNHINLIINSYDVPKSHNFFHNSPIILCLILWFYMTIWVKAYKQFANSNENLFTRSTYGVVSNTTHKLSVE